MKLSTDFFPFMEKYGDYKAATFLKARGFDCIDYSFFAAQMSENYVEETKSFRRHLDEIGLECNQAHSSNVKGAPWDESNPTYAKLVREIECAAILGAKYIIVHPQTLHPFQERKVGLVDHNEKFYLSLQPYCEKFGIKIGIENLFKFDETFKSFTPILGRPAEINEIMGRMDDRYFGFCLDIGHTVFAQYCPEDFIAELDKGLVKCLHVHDNFYNADNHTLPYLGRLNWRKIVQALKEHGYQGDFTYESTNFVRRMPIDLMDDAVAFMVKVGRRFVSKLER